MIVAAPSRPVNRGGRPTSAAWREDPEVDLMLRVRRGDECAFPELVRRYWGQVFGRLYRRVGDRQEAEDLAQEVFLRLYRHRKRYQPRAKFATWVFHITENVARNAYRSRRRHPTHPLHSAGTPGSIETYAGRYLPDRGGETPSRPLERAELARVVRAAVSELGQRQRTALELHQFQDQSYAQVAASMDMSPKAAKSLLYRARNQLRAILEKEDAARFA